MRDGTVLRADVYRPDDDQPHPVLVNRTPYNKELVSQGSQGYNPVRYACEGYVVIIQDCRGTRASEGVFYPFANEIEDGYDTIEWAAAQPWSTGRVGMFGASYSGATQWLCAISQPPHLVTIAPAITASDYHDGWVYQSGAFLLGFSLSWTLSSLCISNLEKMKLPREKQQELRARLVAAINSPGIEYAHFPLKDYPGLKHPGLAPYYYDWLAHPSEDEYWKRWKIEDFYHTIKIPVLNIGGWYDIFLTGTLRSFCGVRQRGCSLEAQKNSRLMVGPWFHGVPGMGSVAGEIDFGVEASASVIDLNGRLLRWFDCWLKGERNGVSEEPPVMVFTMGDNDWKHLDDWPPTRVRYVNWYLHSQGRANSLDGSLTPDLPDSEPPDHYVFDPSNPVPTKGGGLCCAPAMPPGGPYDQRTVETRADVLVYTSESLKRDVNVTGPLSVKLWAASSAPDTDFAAKLVDVHPNGYAQNLSDNLIRARYRESLAVPKLLEPGAAYEYVIDLGGTSNVFKVGHRIRLEVSSSNFPRFDRNTNTGGKISEDRTMVPARQTIFHDVQRPSHIVLPVVAT